MSIPQKTKIVIIGGGVAGTNIARSLSKSLDPSRHEIILINTRPYSILLPPSLRMVASGNNDLKENILVPFDKLFINGNGKFVQGEVVNIDANHRAVELKSAEKIGYDVLVLATGNKWDGPIAFPNEAKEVDEFITQKRKEFESAKSVLLVGGGAVGIELAGEIRDVWSDKEITIINRERLLFNDAYPDKFRKAIQKQLESRNIKVILDNTVSEDLVPGLSDGVPIPTKNGQTLRPDLVVRTWGGRPNTQIIGSSLGQKALTPQGHVKVKPTLQLADHLNIFAAGDIIDWNEQKTSMKASMGHTPIIVKNVISFVNGKNVSAVYKGSTEMIVVTNGKASGLVFMDVLWGLVLGPFFATLFKSKTLLVPALRGAIGY
ncbi:FAD/NAD(P)-binding domain-containing protein [Marasmius fiardii PR-910]|nr:FAD/NAD(P)-binding domain-containing protein [Marasmius fiardii PR-910]